MKENSREKDRSMRVAVCISGQLRFPEIGISTLLNNLLENNVADFYICTYEDENLKPLIDVIKPTKLLLQPKNLEVPITKIAFSRKYPETNLVNMFKMFKNVQDCFELIDQQYDLIIRCRSDQLFQQRFNIKSFDLQKINIPIGGDHRGGILDHFCAGPTPLMNYYCHLYENLNHYIESGVLAHPEILMKHHLFYRNLEPAQTVRINLPIMLVRERNGDTLRLQDATPPI